MPSPEESDLTSLVDFLLEQEHARTGYHFPMLGNFRASEDMPDMMDILTAVVDSSQPAAVAVSSAAVVDSDKSADLAGSLSMVVDSPPATLDSSLLPPTTSSFPRLNISYPSRFLPTLIAPYGSELSLRGSYSTLPGSPTSLYTAESAGSIAGPARNKRKIPKRMPFSESAPDLQTRGMGNYSRVSLSHLHLTPIWQKLTYWARSWWLVQLFETRNGTCIDPETAERDAQEVINQVHALYCLHQERQENPLLPEPGLKMTTPAVVKPVVSALDWIRRRYRKAAQVVTSKASKGKRNPSKFDIKQFLGKRTLDLEKTPGELATELLCRDGFLHDGALDEQGDLIENYGEPLIEDIIRLASYDEDFGDDEDYAFVSGFKELVNRFNLPESDHAFVQTLPDESHHLAAAALKSILDQAAVGRSIKFPSAPYDSYQKVVAHQFADSRKRNPSWATKWNEDKSKKACAWWNSCRIPR